MAQLSDDCFAFGGELMPIEAGLALIGERVVPVTDIETVSLIDADGRILAEDVIAPLALPGYDNSAVDGWAVRHADLNPGGETILPVVTRIAAGDRSPHAVGKGESARIFTGAMMPDGTDTVFMQEDVREEDGRVILPAGLKKGANRRLAGEDIATGAPALASGLRLQPQHVSLASALGLTGLKVRRRLKVAVLSTGDELVEPGRPLQPGMLHDSNRVMMAALLRRAGCEVTDIGMYRDEPDALGKAILAAAKGHDLIISSGGVSTGEEDYTRRVVETVGTLVHWRLAIKPGRPVAMAVVDGVPFVGLPGNPVAVFVTFVNIVRALVARLSGESWTPSTAVPVKSGFAYKKKTGRREFVRVSLVREADGSIVAHKHPREGAGVITSLTETTGFVELPEPVTAVAEGDLIAYRSYENMF
ncbi:molybdopterin molybdenumtransferase MoeA [Terrihabitans soli]|uniref:Molybdopterin molybdenumtransferase n=1 Tax=Terrihabitans soli TaxID=708113 RepID=A0A6S6QVB3_9HYPH|nr:gephyrin-like molybdotransferase Glp [Terrihabitans soli]BCJ91867.1 molybdopterin molybdenumtransferase MoeA [Terrihabitans soli]